MGDQVQAPEPQKRAEYFAGKSNFDWENYLAVRPNYKLSSFYEVLYSYHSSHGGQWEAAYDVGCGPGQVAAEVSSKFANVQGSDPNRYIVEAAQETFKSNPKLQFEACRAEQIVSVDPSRAATADLLTAAECIPLMDLKVALGTFAELVKPNGTLAIWFHGGPIYTSQDASEETVKRVQTLHRKITNHSLKETRPWVGTIWQGSYTMQWGWLDNIPLDPNQWKDVRRIKWNTDHPLSFVDEDTHDFDVNSSFVSAFTKDETEEVRNDKTFWIAKNVNAKWAKNFIDSNMPREKDYVNEEVQGLLSELADKMEGKTWDATWSAALLLATRK
jgi:trans-aconitate 3-methyltransferase